MLELQFEWDERKNEANVRKHGYDFMDAAILFSSAYILKSARTVNGEDRELAIGLIGDDYATAIFTRRGPVIRLISLRRARHGERRHHQEVFGG